MTTPNTCDPNQVALRVLLVDDDPLVQLVASAAMESFGFDVTTFDSGSKALSRVDAVEPDVIVLDYEMPGMSGVALCRELRAGGARTTPILMLTGRDDEESVQAAFDAGCTEYTTKPVNWLVVSKRLLRLASSDRESQALAESTHRLAQAQKLARIGTWTWRQGASSVRLTGGLAEHLGVEDNAGVPIKALFDSLDQAAAQRVHRAVESALSGEAVESTFTSADGVTCRHLVEKDEDPTGDLVLRGTLVDVTEQTAATERADYLAAHDATSGLLNLAAHCRYIEELKSTGESFWACAVRLPGLAVAAASANVGADYASSVMAAMAKRLYRNLRLVDLWSGSVARTEDNVLSVCLLTPLVEETLAPRLALVRDWMEEPLDVQGSRVRFEVEVGLAPNRTNGDPYRLSRLALDQRGTQAVRVASRESEEQVERAITLQRDLAPALASGGIDVHFQALCDPKTRAAVGFEALARWMHPELGPVSPGEFVPIAEQHRLIERLGDHVLETTCQQLAGWLPLVEGLRGSVNVSSIQLLNPDFASNALSLLARYDLPPAALEVEVTESAVLEDSAVVRRNLESLRETGVSIAIDDFGTGHSSLTTLATFPFDTVKIDRSFVQGIHDPRRAQIFESIVGMARGLGLAIVAEGVETEEQLDFARDRCDTVQGYMCGRPLPRAAFASSVLELTPSNVAAATVQVTSGQSGSPDLNRNFAPGSVFSRLRSIPFSPEENPEEFPPLEGL